MVKTIEELVNPAVEKILNEKYADPPPNLLVPEQVWRENKRKEVFDSVSGKDVREKITKGLDICFGYMKSQLPAEEYEKFAKEWKNGTALYSAYVDSHPLDDVDASQPQPDMEEVMKLSQEMIDHFYAAGVQQFQERLYREAVCVFTALVVINKRRHNVWISLGISLQNDQQNQLALHAFDMAALTDPDDPVSYIHAAECSIQDRKFEEAKIFLSHASEAVTRAPQTSEEIVRYINKLRNDCQ